MAYGTVFQIQRFSLHDGPGIRTTVFLKGCPLRCIWCHNPESLLPAPQLKYTKAHCICCRACADCKNRVHSFTDMHHVDFKRCAQYGHCVSVCPANALSIIGRTYTAEQVIETVLRDKPYYLQSGGGLTVSGGEPLMQPEFAIRLLRLAKLANIHTCVDTSGYASWQVFQKIVPLTDLFLYDYKLSEEQAHLTYTGVSNTLILENLDRLYKSGAAIMIRCPIVPGINDTETHFEHIRELRRSYPRLAGIEIMPYHNIGAQKWQEIGLDYALSELPSATDSQTAFWQTQIQDPQDTSD